MYCEDGKRGATFLEGKNVSTNASLGDVKIARQPIGDETFFVGVRKKDKEATSQNTCFLHMQSLAGLP